MLKFKSRVIVHGMKKIITILFTVLFSFGLIFAQESNGYDSSEEGSVFAPSLSFSVFGPEVGVLFGNNHAEFSASLAIAAGEGMPYFFNDYDYNYDDTFENSSMVAITPKLHAGYNFEAFDTGWTDTLGLAYASSIGIFDNGTVENMEAIALYYRGGIRTKVGLEVGMTSYLPFVYFIAGPKDFKIKTIGNTDGFFECIGAGLLCTSFNLRWYF